MKIKNPAPLRPERQIRGISSGLRAGVRGITVRDDTTDVHPTLDIKFEGAVVTELDDDTALVTIGGGVGTPGDGGSGTPGGTPGTSGPSPVLMYNNSGQDLPAGSVVVVDETADRAVTTTTTVGDTRIAGITIEDIPVISIGKVLFNGYAASALITGSPERGQYLRTSATAGYAEAVDARTAGTFAVVLSALDIPTFASDSAVTIEEVPVTSISIDMPATVTDTTAVGRMLFLALWRDPTVTTAVTLSGWTRIGSTSGFWYYTRVCVGGDTATASWSTASVAVAAVLVLDGSVVIADPVEDFDYDATTSAAGITGLSPYPRYAIAAVQAEEDAPTGWTLLASGATEFEASGAPALVQSKDGDGGATGTSFDANPTIGNLLVAIPTVGTSGLPADVDLYDPRDPGTCPAVTDWDLQDEFYGATSGGAAGAIRTKIANETYAGPFKTTRTCTADSGRATVTLLEFENVGSVAAVLTAADDQNNNTIDLGTFSGYGAQDIIVMAVVFKKDGGGDPGVSYAAEGFTQLVDHEVSGGQFRWIGYKIGGSANAKVTHSGGANYNWGAAAIHITAGSQGTAGTLVGKFIGSAATVDSPFTGVGDELDGVFALNISAPPNPSALLYGPDLVDATDEGGVDATNIWRPLKAYNGTSWEDVIDDAGQAVMAFGP